MSGPGFYKKDVDGDLSFAPNSVLGPGITLHAELQASYTYPVDGWTWRSSDVEASTGEGIQSPKVRYIARRLMVAFRNLPRAAAIAMALRLVQLLPNYDPPE